MQVEELRELGETEQKRVDKVVGILSMVTTRGDDLAEIVHDACNMVTALDLYCDLLQGPGVLAAPFAHYSGELRLVAAASRRLVDKLISHRDFRWARHSRRRHNNQHNQRCPHWCVPGTGAASEPLEEHSGGTHHQHGRRSPRQSQPAGRSSRPNHRPHPRRAGRRCPAHSLS